MTSMPSIRASDGRELNLYEWPVKHGEQAMMVAIVHGYGEHAGRYGHVAESFNARGIGAVAVDLRGHGKSAGGRGHIDRFEEYHLDVAALLETARAQSKGAPVAVLGHSMGGLVAADVAIAGGLKGIAGLVMSSPFLGLALEVNPMKEALGRAMSRFIPTLALPSGLYGKDVTRDPKLAALYDTDPLNNKKATARWFTEATKAIERVHARAGEIGCPMLLLYGGADRVASADASDRFAQKLKGDDITVERLEGHYHEIMNEPPEIRAKVLERMAAWLLARVQPRC